MNTVSCKTDQNIVYLAGWGILSFSGACIFSWWNRSQPLYCFWSDFFPLRIVSTQCVLAWWPAADWHPGQRDFWGSGEKSRQTPVCGSRPCWGRVVGLSSSPKEAHLCHRQWRPDSEVELVHVVWTDTFFLANKEAGCRLTDVLQAFECFEI